MQGAGGQRTNVRVRASGTRGGYWARKDSLTHSLHHHTETGWVSAAYPEKWFSCFQNMMEYKEKHELDRRLAFMCPYDSSSSESESEA